MDDYVAWCRYVDGGNRIVLCDSCDDGAFKVYRHRAVETSEKPENPFKGRHWDEVARDANRDDALAETLCIRDLRDELDRQAWRKRE